MSTVRIGRRRRYTQVDRRVFRDFDLSLRALGLLVWLLDKPDDWRVDSRSISRDVKEGREAIRTAMRELEDAGFLVRRQFREGGRWASEVVVYEHPELVVTEAQEPVTVPATEAQETGAQETGAGKLGATRKTGDGKPEKESTAADAAGTLVLLSSEPPEPTTGQRASAILAGYIDWCAAQKPPREKPARAGQAAQAIRLMLDAGHPDAAVKRACVDAPTITTSALEVAIRRLQPQPARQAAEGWDRSKPSRIVEL